ncbi:MAG: translocation/assembly module TamB domain-containing protein [Desulfococcaceae bacterium]
MKPFWKKILIGFGTAVGLLFLLIVGLLFYIQTDSAHRIVRNRLNAAIPGTVSWERLELSVFRGRLEIVGLRVADPEEAEVAVADRVGVNLAWAALPGGTVRVQEARLVSPRVDLRPGPNGRLNLIRAFASPGPPPEETPKEGGAPPVNVRVDELVLADGRFAYVAPSAEGSGEKADRLTLRGIGLEGRGINLKERRGTVKLSVDGGEVDMAGVTASLEKLALDVGVKGDRIEPLELEIRADGPALTVSGSASDLSGTPMLDGTLELSADLAAVARLVGLGTELSGPVAVKLVASGAATAPEADLTLSYGGGALAGTAVDSLELRAKLSDRRLTISRLTAAAPGADLDLTGSADLAEAFAGGLIAAPTDLSALTYDAKIDEAAVRFAELLPQSGMGGTVRLQGTASGQGVSPKNLRAEADLTAAAEGFSVGETVSPLDADLDLMASLRDGTVTAKTLSLRVAEATLSVTGDYRLADRSADAEVRLTAPDLAALLSPVGVAQLAGSANLTAQVAGDVMKPNLDLTLSGASLAWDAIQIGALELAAARNPEGAVRVDSLTVENAESRLRAEGSLELFRGGWGIAERMPAELTAALTSVSATDFLPNLPLRGPVNGEIAYSGSLLGPDRVGFSLTADPLAVAEAAIGQVSAEGEMVDGTVRLSPLTVANGKSRARLSGTADLFAPGSWGLREDPAFDLALDADPIHPGEFVETLGGAATLSAQIGGTLSAPTVDADLSATDLAAGDLRIGDVQGDLRMADGRLRVDPLTVTNQRSAARLAGTLRLLDPETLKPLGSPTADLTLVADSFYPGDFRDDLSGKLALSAEIAGPLKAPQATATLNGDDLAAAGTRIGSLSAEASFADGRLSLDPLTVTNQRSKARLVGTLRLLDPETMTPLQPPTADLKLTADPLHPGDFRDDLSGKLTLSADIAGPLTAPEATATLRGDDLAAAGTRIGAVTAEVGFSGGELTLRPLSVENGESKLEVTGTAQVLDPQTLAPLSPPRFDLRAEGDPVRLEDFVSGMEGRLTLTAAASGTPQRLRGAVSLSGDDLDFGAQTVESVRVEARLEDERVRVAPAVLTLREGDAVRADGWYSPSDGRYDLRLRTDGVSLAAIDALEERDLESGRVRFDLAGAGRVSRPAVQGDVVIEGVRINGEDLAPLRLNLDVSDGVARITGDADFSVDARYDLDSRDFSADLRFSDTALGPYFQMAGQSELDGGLTAAITAQGNAGNPQTITAEVDVDRLDVSRGDLPLIEARPFTATLRDRRLAVENLRLALLEEGYLAISGTGRLDGTLDFRADGRIPVAVARSLGVALEETAGEATLDARVTGPANAPDVDATVAVSEAGLIVPGLQQKLSGVNGRLRLTPQKLTLENLEGRLDEGRFSVSGSADLENFQPTRFNADLNANRLPVSVPDTLELLLNADIALEGTPEKSRASGELALLEGLYYRDVDLSLVNAATRERTRAEPAGGGGPAPPLLSGMELDITVKHRSPFVVDNNVALLSLKPNVRVRGTAANPLITGRAENTEGTVTYQRTEFEVERGVVDFLNPYQIEPTLDIRAVSDVRKWTITLAVSGTPKNLKFQLSSTPRETDEDILSLLLLGRTTQELVRQEGGSSFSVKQVMGDILSGRLSRGFRDATGLDVELGYEAGDDEENAGGVDVTIGKELSRRVTVKYGVESRGGETIQKGTAEYKFLENLIMGAFQDTEGEFGGELIFRMEFR